MLPWQLPHYVSQFYLTMKSTNSIFRNYLAAILSLNHANREQTNLEIELILNSLKSYFYIYFQEQLDEEFLSTIVLKRHQLYAHFHFLKRLFSLSSLYFFLKVKKNLCQPIFLFLGFLREIQELEIFLLQKLLFLVKFQNTLKSHLEFFPSKVGQTPLS